MSDRALPSWTPSRSDKRRHSRPYVVTLPNGTWRVTQQHLLMVILLAVLATVTLTSLLWQPPSTITGSRLVDRGSTTATSMDERKEAVREAMQFVWRNYHERAFGADEIQPITGVPDNNWGGVGCMILDSMDTLWIMDLSTEFEQARKWVHTKLRFDEMGQVSVFETIIRSVGGLLSAYDLSKDRMFLAKAAELADRLMPAINPVTGRAHYLLDTHTNRSRQAGTLAESGTYQLEFEYLSLATGDPKYATLARKLYPYLRRQDNIQTRGLFANEIYSFDFGQARTGLEISMGPSGDSFYEYLLKVWILTGQQGDALAKEMYSDAMDGMEHLLLHQSTSGNTFLGDFSLVQSMRRPHMHHLACFVPGLLTLGARRMESEDPSRSRRHILIAQKLMKTCYEDFYAKQPSGLSPECLVTRDLDNCPGQQEYKLRPEVVESLYVMYQLTGDVVYQEWGWNIFSSIQRHCRTHFGYSQYRDVTKVPDWDAMTSDMERNMWTVRTLSNKMETFFTAETLKYLFLLFDPHNKHVSLDTHVFNTEAHPLSIPKKH